MDTKPHILGLGYPMAGIEPARRAQPGHLHQEVDGRLMESFDHHLFPGTAHVEWRRTDKYGPAEQVRLGPPTVEEGNMERKCLKVVPEDLLDGHEHVEGKHSIDVYYFQHPLKGKVPGRVHLGFVPAVGMILKLTSLKHVSYEEPLVVESVTYDEAFDSFSVLVKRWEED